MGGARGNSISKWQCLVIRPDFEKDSQGLRTLEVVASQNTVVGADSIFVFENTCWVWKDRVWLHLAFDAQGHLSEPVIVRFVICCFRVPRYFGELRS